MSKTQGLSPLELLLKLIHTDPLKPVKTCLFVLIKTHFQGHMKSKLVYLAPAPSQIPS